MANSMHLSRKKKFIKVGKRTRWAPFWVVPKINGLGRKLHPGRHTFVKRHWKRTKIKA